MATTYHKKASPKQPVYIHGRPIKFEQINIELGVFQTDDENIQREIRNLQAREVGGIFTITEEEYNALKEKKTTNSLGHYRDEFGKAFDPSKTHRPDNDLVSHAGVPSENPVAQPVVETVPETAVKPSAKPLPRKRTAAQ